MSLMRALNPIIYESSVSYACCQFEGHVSLMRALNPIILRVGSILCVLSIGGSCVSYAGT